MAEIFGEEGEGLDVGYNNIKSAKHPVEANIKQFVEALWAKYEPYADSNFVQEFAKNPEPRYWEMYLACALMDMGYTIVSKDAGPDIGIQLADKKVWIEAIAPTPGAASSPDRVPDLIPINKGGGVQNVPVGQIVLRYTAALAEKKEKYEKYIKDGIVSDNDTCIVAISAALIHQDFGSSDIPYIVRAVYPFGDQYVTFSTDTFEVVETGVHYQKSILKKSGIEIPKTAFLGSEYSLVSGVIFCPKGMGNSPAVLGSDFRTVHNLKAKNQLTQGFVSRGVEYWLVETKDAYELKSTKLTG